ncbi:MAG: hypothetical protein EXS36_10285 [Pedosphaera sp.]|nr:hypothetical protein [Pedosphaera sp.]
MNRLRLVQSAIHSQFLFGILHTALYTVGVFHSSLVGVIRLSLAAVTVICTATPLRGQSVTRLDPILPGWFERGTTNEIILRGENLRGVQTIRFSGAPGVSASVVPSVMPAIRLESSSGGLAATAATDSQDIRIRLQIAPDAPMGLRELRTVGPNGFSNPQTIQLSDFPELTEQPGTGATNSAPVLPLPCAVSGVISQTTEADWYRFTGSKGQRIIIDVQANRFGSRLDPAMVIYEAAGRELARSNDAHGLDPFLEFMVPANGDYFIRLQDVRFQGSGEHRYRMILGELPYLDAIFPYGGRRGTTVSLQLDGRMLDGVDRMQMTVATNAPMATQEVRIHTRRGYSNPQLFEAGDLPEITETEPNNQPDQANRIQVPATLNGRIGTEADLDHYRFTSPSDQRWILEIGARRFGSPLDALLVLMDGAGKVISQNDDANGPDARIEADLKKGQEYIVGVRDLTERGGARFGYRLSLKPTVMEPDFGIRISNSRYRLAAGAHLAIRCELDRRNGFASVVRVEAESLPVGVTCTAAVFSPESPPIAWLILTAAPDVRPEHHDLVLVATGDREGQRLRRTLQARPNFLSIVPSIPLTVDALTPMVELDQNGGSSVEVQVTRSAEFTGDVRVVAEELPGLSLPAITIPAGQSRGRLQISAANNSEVSTRWLMIFATASVGGQDFSIHAPNPLPVRTGAIPFFLTTAQPRLSVTALPVERKSPAAAAELIIKIDRRLGFTNEIETAVEGIPDGVQFSLDPVAANARETVLKLLATEKAPSGKQFDLVITGTALHQQRQYKLKSSSVKLIIAAPDADKALVTK